MEKFSGVRGLFAVISLFAAFGLTGCNQGGSAPSQGSVSANDRIPNPGACDIGSAPAIINGTPLHAGFELVPSIVRVYSIHSDGNANVCTGTLLDSDTVLTAAHCVNDMTDAGKILVHFHHDPGCETNGPLNDDRDKKNDPSFLNVRKASSFLVHKDYSTEFFLNDLALIKLGQSAPANARPVSITNWMTTSATARAKVLAIGYGKITSYDVDDNNHRLRYGFVKQLLETSRKAKLVGHMSDRGLLDSSDAFVDKHWLFFDQSDANGVCAGDSGGPAFVKVDGKWAQVGVASFVTNVSIAGGEVCKDIGAHVNLSGYVGWLEGARRYLRYSSGRNTY